MGLDNGFRVKNINKADIPGYLSLPWTDEYSRGGEVELVYWRKCWGLRDAVLKILHEDHEEYAYVVEAEDIPAIIRAITPFMSKEYWEEEGDSIWTFEEKFPSLLNDLLILQWLGWYMKEHPYVECYFYDSY